MPSIIDPETINADPLPGIWSPVQWELTEGERIHEVDEQARASLLWSVDVPEAVLRLLLGETEISRVYEPPAGYNPEIQGEWDSQLVTYEFRRQVQLLKVERRPNYLYLEYKLEDLGYWVLEIEPENVSIRRI